MTPLQRTLIQRLKNHPDANLGLAMPIFDEFGIVHGHLAPITMVSIKNADICAALFNWRNRYMHLFLSVYENTPERALAWLEKDVLGDSARLPFLIYAKDGTLVGSCGVCAIEEDKAELDTMMRGSPKGGPNLMKFAQTVLIHWIFSALSVDTISGRILSKNVLVRKFHDTFGFRDSSQVPLRKENTADGYRLVEDLGLPESDRSLYLIHSEIKAHQFYSCHPWIKPSPIVTEFMPEFNGGESPA